MLKPGVPGVAVMKAIDNALGGRGIRIVETGPEGSEATLYGWRPGKPASDGHDALVAAVSHSDPVVAAYYTATPSGRWPE